MIFKTAAANAVCSTTLQLGRL